MSWEKLIVVGHLGAAEEKMSANGTAYVRLAVAVDRGAREHKKTVWYTVLLFGRLVESARAMLPYYTKGRLVLVEGRPQAEIYERRDGTQDIDHVLVASALPELLDYKK